jgi:thiamine-phosphate pyrophosphorylase
VNDRIDIALAIGADGVHVGQDDLPSAAVRKLAGKQFIIGLSTHSPDQIDAAAELDADYIGVGPIYETPTKEGRPAVGTQLVRYAAQHAVQTFFAIGGLNARNVDEVIHAGARGVSVLRWIAQADDPKAAARELLDSMERECSRRET